PGSASPASAGPSGASAGTGPASGSPGPGGAGTGAAGSQPPAAWIPDSSLWLDIARSTVAGAGQVQPTGINVASTPLMIAMPRQAAARLPAYGASVGWQFLLPQAAGGPSHALGLHVRIPDPSQSGTGLATLMAMRRLLGPGQQGRLGLAAFTFNAQVLPTTDSAVVLHSLAAPGQVSAGSPTRARSEPVTVTSEQSVVQYDRAHPQQPLAVRYPDPGTADLDYPYALTAAGDQQSLLAAAEQFGQLLTSSYATSYLRYEGFRSSDGTTASRPAAAGLTTRAPSQLPQPGPGQAASLLRAWAKLGLGARDLVLLDVSSAMAVPAGPGGPSLDSELKQAAANGLARFPDSTQMGLWAFASHLTGSLPYKQLVSIGPLPSSLGLVTRHQQIQQLTQGGTTVQAPAALYRAILAAYRQVLDSYQPRYVNAVVVMTAGVDSDPGDIPAGTLVRELRNLQDPQRPVEIVAIMVGRQGNLRALQQIAAVTGGQASAITSPGQIAKLFFSAISRRLCQPACPSG
ncbi:MAG: substrate-binding domain-containing protein, partial [Actinobacteria bacterium]|nr:substrate-binding domain-containing protein [Actinomycetota bacterium]